MPKVKCTKCGHVSDEGTSACSYCGTSLPRIRTVEPSPSNNRAPAAPQQPGQMVYLREGQNVAHRYTVVNMVGRGGMGCIYRVFDTVLREEVALKTLLPQFARDKLVLERFLNEARIARQLSHPNIVRVHDIGQTDDCLYISMELLRGKSLRTLLDECGPGRRFPVKAVLSIFDQLCDALEYAHARTVHRDLKPENIMVDEKGNVKLMDFGISKLMTNTRLTGVAMVMGTPYYMSPEQLKDSGSVDQRADIYSMGVVLYELITGQMPSSVPRSASQAVPEVPPPLLPIIAKCCATDPAERYQSAQELRAALRPIREMVEADPGSIMRPSGKPQKKAGAKADPGRLKTVLGVSLLVLMLAIMLGGMGWVERSWKKTEDRRAQKQVEVSQSGAVSQVSPVQDADTAMRADYVRMYATLEKLRATAETSTASDSTISKILELAKAAQDGLVATPENIDSAMNRRICTAIQYYALPLLYTPEVMDNMVLIPAGRVNLPAAVEVGPFFMDKAEVTNARYLEFCASAQWRAPANAAAQPSDYPVTGVTFYDAQAYAAWLNKKLPTEAQWARAAADSTGAVMKYPWGSVFEDGAANFTGAPDTVLKYERDLTSDGIVGLAGNASEWTRTLFRPLPYTTADGRDDPAAPDFGKGMVVRGGNYGDTVHSPMDQRQEVPFEAAYETLGFRCVVTPPATLAGMEKLAGM